MSGHHHPSDPSLTQNQGNVLGDRPCVRQSRLYREQCGGNSMKELLGQSELKWDTTQTEGCYKGGRVYDHNTTDLRAARQEEGQTSNEVAPTAQRKDSDPSQGAAPAGSATGGPIASRGFRPGAGQANKQTYNIFGN